MLCLKPSTKQHSRDGIDTHIPAKDQNKTTASTSTNQTTKHKLKPQRKETNKVDNAIPTNINQS
jgi:hypothetical protein